MRTVSASWENYQKKQIRPKIDIKGHISPVQLKPEGFYPTTDLSIHCTYMDAFAFYCDMFLNGSYVEFRFYSGNVQANPSKFNIELLGFATKSNLVVSLMSGSSVVKSDTYENIITNNTTYTFNRVRFSLNIGATQNEMWGVKYFDITSGGVDFDSSYLKNLNYTGHSNIINKDLPYHKVVMETYQKFLPKQFNYVYLSIGYKDLNEFVSLGCGYYLLENYKSNENGQTFNLCDCISTMTKKYCHAINRTPIFTSSGYTEILRCATAYYGWYRSGTYFRSYLSSYNFYNVDYTQLTSLSNNISTLCFPYESTCAQAIQMIAQAYGLTMYVDSKNQIVFRNVQDFATINDDNDLWIIDSQIEETEKVGKLIVNCSSYSKSAENTPIYEKAASDITETINYVNYLNGAYTRYRKNGSDVPWNANYYTYNSYEDTDIVGNASLITADSYSYLRTQAKQTTIDSNINNTYTLSTLIVKPAETLLASNYLTYWLAKINKQTINTRLDPKYELCDILHSTNGLYADFVITDINATFNGGYSGTISGIVLNPLIKAPKLTNISMISSSNYHFTIFNPNDSALTLHLKTDNSTTLDINIGNYGSETVSNGSVFDSDVADFLTRHLSNDLIAWFEDGNGNTSKTTTILKANN